MAALFGNWRTTLFGFLAGFFLYVQQQGITIPSDSKGLKSFGLGLMMALLGYVAKDSATGSKPS